MAQVAARGVPSIGRGGPLSKVQELDRNPVTISRIRLYFDISTGRRWHVEILRLLGRLCVDETLRSEESPDFSLRDRDFEAPQRTARSHLPCPGGDSDVITERSLRCGILPSNVKSAAHSAQKVSDDTGPSRTGKQGS